MRGVLAADGSLTPRDGVLDFLLVSVRASPDSALREEQGAVAGLSTLCPLACSGVWKSSLKSIKFPRDFALTLGVPGRLLLP